MNVPMNFHGPTNYDVILSACKEFGVPCLDLNPVFSMYKDTVRFPLFPKYGGHWSEYGSLLAGDTLLVWLAKQCGLDSPRLRMIPNISSTTPEGLDYDLGNIVNLWTRLPCELMNYPQFDVQYPATWHADDWLLIGDSHTEQLIFKGIFQQMEGGDPEFWLYFREVMNDREYQGWLEPDHRVAKMRGSKCIVLFISERFFHNLFYEVPMMTWTDLGMQPPLSPIERTELDMLPDPPTFFKVRSEAKRQNITIESALRMEAERYLDESK